MKFFLNFIRLGVLTIVCIAGFDLSHAVDAPEREIPVQGDIDPFTVVLYGDINYKEEYATFRLQPGKRMLKIPQLKKFPASVLLGSKVGLLLFYDSNFHSSYYVVSGYYDGYPSGYRFEKFGRVTNSTPVTYGESDDGGSIIIHRKDIGDFLGVYLWNQFYALPEDSKKTSIVYNQIPKIDDADIKSFDIVPGGTGVMSIPHGHPRPDDIKITVIGQYGVCILPQGNKTEYKVSDIKNGHISSIKIDYQGPYDHTAYFPTPKHRAPAAKSSGQSSYDIPEQKQQQINKDIQPVPVQPPVQAKGREIHLTPNISGKWRSSIGRIYHITQDKQLFEWAVENSEEVGWGSIDGHDLHVEWKGPRGQNKTDGTITNLDDNQKAMRIKWNNGVMFFR